MLFLCTTCLDSKPLHFAPNSVEFLHASLSHWSLSDRVMHAKIQLNSVQNAKVLNQDRQYTERALRGELGKIIAQLKHNYNAFPELRTRFFHKQCVIW